MRACVRACVCVCACNSDLLFMINYGKMRRRQRRESAKTTGRVPKLAFVPYDRSAGGTIHACGACVIVVACRHVEGLTVVDPFQKG